MTGHDFIRISCAIIPERSRVLNSGRCWIRAIATYCKKDGTPFSDGEREELEKTSFGQTTDWKFSPDFSEAEVFYECDSSD